MISIIIPIYNSEKYIRECINSVISQTYEDFELILVDDGSTDCSFQICHEYTLSDERIKLHNTSNAGVSSARNFGIEKAKGEWITFIDSDDYLLNNSFLSDLINATINTEADLCLTTGCIKFGHEKIVFNEPGIQLNTSYILEHIIGLNQIYLSPWGRLFKTSIIKENNIRFIEGLHYAEDCYFNLEYLRYVTYTSIVDNKGYYYRENIASITHNYRPYNHYIDFLTNLFNLYEEYKSTYKIKQIDDYFIGFHLIGNCLSIIYDLYNNKYDTEVRKETISKLNELIDKAGESYKNYLINYKTKIKIGTLRLPFWLSNIILKMM